MGTERCLSIKSYQLISSLSYWELLLSSYTFNLLSLLTDMRDFRNILAKDLHVSRLFAIQPSIYHNNLILFRANQVTDFYMLRTLVVKWLIRYDLHCVWSICIHACIRISEWTKNTVDKMGMLRSYPLSSSRNSEGMLSVASSPL